MSRGPWQQILKTATTVASVAAKKVAARAVDAAVEAIDADRLLQRGMSGLIEYAGRRYPLDPGAQWAPGKPLSLLLVGYAGTRNTGADVRVEEMIRQFRHLYGDDHLELSILTLNPELTAGYFKTVKQLRLPDVFPRFLFDEVHKVHGVVACEGSMFKSKFANALSTLMAGGLGLACAEHKLAVGYGGEAGKMDPPLEDFVRRHCKDAFIIARNQESVGVLGRLGVAAEKGTDTAWTFDPAPAEVGRDILMEHGWDGERPVLVLCPINPFWWPVRADLVKGIERFALQQHKDAHYKSVYFHNSSAEIDAKQEAYLDAIAGGVKRMLAERPDTFVICVGMEQLDRRACEALAPKIGALPGTDGLLPPVIVSDTYDMYQMVSALRQCTAMVSSRYHAIVTSMPGLVASAGITMDERIRNLMADRGQPELALEVDDPELEPHLYEVLLRLLDDGAAISEGIGRTVVANLERMGEMGMMLVEQTRARHPDFPFRDGLGAGGDPWDHLPVLPPAVQALVDTHGANKAAAA